MKINPKNVRIVSLLSSRKALVSSVCAFAAICLFACAVAAFAKEPDSSETDGRLTGTITAFSSGKEEEEIVVSGNNSYLVSLKVDGEEYSYVYEDGNNETVLDLLYRNDVYLNEDDEINHSTDEPLAPDMSVEVGRVTYKEVTERVSIPYETTRIQMSFALSSSMKGTYASRLRNTNGVPGVREVTTRVKMVNGVVTEKTTISSKVVSKPVNAVVYVDASYLLDLGNGAPESYQSVLNCQFTAYTYTSTGSSTTASGATVRVGYVAVDRSVIPMHSYLYIVLDNGFTYGYCYAKDTGGAIKGNIVDVFLPSETDCVMFGRRTGKVYIIRSGS